MAFVHPIDVRYLEVDQQGVVFNMWYLAYFDDAMTGFLAHLGIDYRAMVEAGHDVQLVHTEIDWTGGVGLHDRVGIEVGVNRLGTTSFALGFAVLRNDEPVATAEIVYVCVATDGSGKRPIPADLRSALGADPAP